ncbi:EB module, partial [Teladorsagia circumcincta]
RSQDNVSDWYRLANRVSIRLNAWDSAPVRRQCACVQSSNCNYDQVLIGNQCYPLVKIGAQCIYSQQCSGGSSCLSNVCRCPSGTFDNGDGYCRNGSRFSRQSAVPYAYGRGRLRDELSDAYQLPVFVVPVQQLLLR